MFGPLSPSKICLWSFPEINGIKVLPSVIERIEASIPSKNSSITILLPAPLKISKIMKSSIVFIACSLVLAITTPFPDANPSALITIG